MDRVRIGRFDKNKRFAPILDVNDGVNYAFVRDQLRFNEGEAVQVVANQERRWGGGRVVGESTNNGSLETEWYVGGANKDAAINNAEDLVALLKSAQPGLYIEDRPEGAAQSVYYEVRGPGKAQFVRSWARWQSTSKLDLVGMIPTAPLPVGDYLDIADDFGTNTIADYTFDAGGGTLSVSNGGLVLSSTAEKRLFHSAKGYKYGDWQATLEFTTGASVTGASFEIIKRVSSSVYLRFMARQSGNVISIQTETGASGDHGTVSFTMAANTRYWLRARQEGNVVNVEMFTVPPTPTAAPAAGNAPYVLTPAQQTSHGMPTEIGIRINGVTGTDHRIESFVVEPYTYRNVVLPERIVLPQLPGSAPAEVDLEVTEAPAAAQPWALFGWASGERTRNMLWNGDFEINQDGWGSGTGYTDGFTNINAPVSALRTTGQKKFGTASLEIITNNANQGRAFRIYHRFKRGVTYTASVWVRANNAADTLSLRFGNGDADSVDTFGFFEPGTAWTQRTWTWTPTADYGHATLIAKTTDTGSVTFHIDGVQVYAGTNAPTLDSQLEGRGAIGPIGVFEAEDGDYTTSLVLTADATRSSGQVLQWTTSGAGNQALGYWFDPNLIDPDDFSLNDLRIEAWAWVKVASTLVTPTLTTYTSFEVSGMPIRPTQEPDRIVVKPSSGTLWRLTRLGTLAVSSTPLNATRWVLNIEFDVSAGSSGTFSIDQIVLVPAQRRLSSVTAQPFDASYPSFLPSTTETTRILRADGTAGVRKPNGQYYPAPHLSGALPEMGPGDVTLVAATSNRVPDDPTIGTGEASYGPTATIHASVRPRYFSGRGE